MSGNIRTHIEAQKQYLRNLYHEKIEEVEKHRAFYDEYFAMLDMSAELCLGLFDRIFIYHDVAENCRIFKGAAVDFADITDIPLFAMAVASRLSFRPYAAAHRSPYRNRSSLRPIWSPRSWH